MILKKYFLSLQTLKPRFDKYLKYYIRKNYEINSLQFVIENISSLIYNQIERVIKLK